MTVSLSAHAKLTLSLRVTGVRPDGYHLIDAEMVTLSLADHLTIASSSTTALTVDGRYATGVPSDRSNLVVRATELARRPAHVSLTKSIPHGGGLGGGSADAAALLRWAGFPTDDEGLALAAQLGADIPFCLVGGRARVRGIGELVDPLPYRDMTVTLVIPPVQVSTPAVYRAWDALDVRRAPGPNDLEPAALRVAPELAYWRDSIRARTGRTPVLAGSGASWFVYGNHSKALAALSNEGAEVLAVHTC